MSNNFLLNRVVLFSWMLVCIVLSFIDISFLGDNLEVDSNLLIEFSYSNTGLVDGSYGGTARLFSLIPLPLITVAVLIIGCASLYLFMKDLRRPSSLLLALIITAPAMVLFLVRPQKETVVLLLTMLVLYIARSPFLLPKFKVIIIAIIYILYGLAVRKYYLLILPVFLYLHFSSNWPWLVKVAMCLVSIILLFFLPADFFLKTQGMRDVVNYYLGTDLRIIRTAFKNPFYADNALHFILNYLYAAIRLHIPIIFTLSYKEFLHIITVVIFARFIIIGKDAKKCIESQICSQLIFAHILVLIIFEPDLGSYLRHLTSVFLYLTPMFILYDKHKHKRINFIWN